MINNNYSARKSSPYNSLSFKGVNFIQVSKKAFENSADSLYVSAIFDYHMGNVIKQGNPLRQVLSLLGIGKNPDRYFSFLETPCFVQQNRLLSKFGFQNCSMEWLSKNTGIDIKPQNPLLHSFYVLTGKHKDKASELTSVANRAKTLFQANFPAEKTEFQKNIILNNLIDGQVFNIMEGAPVQKFSADTLEDIENIARKIDLNT